jgi:hypothetical protein
MKIWILFFALMLATTARSQETSKKYFFSEVGWTIVLPEGFETADSIDIAKDNQRGLKLIEESNNVTADLSELKTLISAKKDAYNYFNSTIRKFNAAEEGDYDSTTKMVKNMLYKTFLDNMPDARIDSVSTIEILDELSFDKFHVTITLKENIKLDMVLLSKNYKGYDFGISYLYLDNKSREQIESMLKNSKFMKRN